MNKLTSTKIERAKTADIGKISILFNQYRMFYNMPSDLEACKIYIENRLSNADSLIYLARTNNHASGFIQIYPTFSSVAMRPAWTLNDLFVDPAYRKQLIAKALMIKIEDEAFKAKIYSIKLSTAIDNLPAKKLYESIGYSQINQFDNYSLTPGRYNNFTPS